MAYQAPTVTVGVLRGNLNNALEPSFFDVVVTSASTLNLAFPGTTTYDAWCLDFNLGIGTPAGYTASIYSAYELGVLAASPMGSLPYANDPFRANLDNINWLLNFYTGTGYTPGEVQVAIWRLIGQDPGPSYVSSALGAYNSAQADILVNLALTTGEGYVPGVGQTIGIILDPVNSAGVHQQPLIIESRAAGLGDFVWQDTNENGIQDSGEAGIAGVTVNLVRDLDGNGSIGAGEILASTTTNSAGKYAFIGLTPGLAYQVQFDTPAGFVATTRQSDSSSASGANSDGLLSDVVFLAPGENNTTLDAGFYKPVVKSSISGFVYEDAGNDGIKNPGEAGIPGVTVKLTGTNDLGQPVTATTTTDGTGAYSFPDLRPGNYTVTETQPANYLDGKDTAGSTSGSVASNEVISNIVLLGGDPSVNNNFGELKPAAISGYVYHDVNNDGSRTGDSGIPTTTVTLTGTDDLGNPVTLSTSTGADGSYSFPNLRPGSYTVTETQPAGYFDGKDTAGTNGATVNGNDVIKVTVAGGQTSVENNFGEVKAASIAGVVFYDANNDGLRAGDTGIGSVSVTLTGTDDLGAAVSVTKQTAADGSYLFDGLRPGTYSVTESQPVSYLDGKDTAGTIGGVSTGSAAVNDKVTGIVLAAGQASIENNFGEILPATISGYVFHDVNNDGSRAGDSGIGGVAVVLTGTDDLGNSVNIPGTTAANGAYSFTNLRPGTYTVTETQPSAYLDGKDSAGTINSVVTGSAATNDKVTGIVLAAGQSSVENNFGEILPAKLSGFVYVDAGDDGIKGAGEAGIGGVTVALSGTNDLGQAVTGTATTAADGSYSFTNLRPGSYTVTETQPTTYVDGKDTAGSTGGTVTNDKIAAVVLVSGDNSINNNFGELVPVVAKAKLGDLVFLDANANGVQDTGELGIAGVTVNLKNAGGTVIGTTTTNGSGIYGFEVDAGTYSVQVVAPTGYTITASNVGDDAKDSDIDSAGNTGTYTLAAGQTNLTIDGGLYQNAKIGDRIWYDKNANGIQDSGEANIAGVTVDLKDAATGNVVASQVTNSTGNYLFTVKPGDYFIDVQENTLPAGFIFTKPNANSNANEAVDSDVQIRPDQVANGATLQWGQMASTNLTSGEDDRTWDAGVYKVGIDVEKYVSGTTTTTTTNCGKEGADCNYWKNNCQSSTTSTWVSTFLWYGYWQTSTTPTGWGGITQCKATDSFNSVFGVNCAGGTKSVYDVLCGTGTSSLDKFMREAVSAYLNACHDKVDYAFSKDQVCAQVQNTVSSGNYDHGCNLFSSENGKGCDWNTNCETTTSTVNTQLYDADAPPGLEVKTGSVVTFTYVVKNTGDTALSNITLTDDRIQTVTYVSGDTNNNGLLDLTESWTYKATEVAQSGTIKNTATVLGTDSVGGIAKVTDKDDAYYTGTGALKGSIGDRVFHDANANGLQDGGETGVSGIAVTLKGAGTDGIFGNADDITATTTTGANGTYLFSNLNAGKYQVVFGTSGSGYLISPQNQGANDAVDSDIDSTGTTGVITLGAGEQNLSVDAGIYKQTASVGDRIWYDKNANGIQDSGEAGIAGVKVDLYNNATGTIIATTTTSSSGAYSFTGLQAGSYHIDVQEGTLPSGFIFTKSNQGSNDAVDSDVAALSASIPLSWGKTANFNLVGGQNDTTRDAGAYKVGIDVEKYVSGTTTTTTTHCGGEGANVSYWKSNCTYQSSLGTNGWANTGCKGSTSFNSLFGVSCTNGSKSIYDILCGTGTGALDVLMRECVAAYLNACHSSVDYAFSKEQVVADLKYALSCGDYSTSSSHFSRENNLGCNFSSTAGSINCTVDTQLYDSDAPPGLEVKTGSVVTFTYIVKNTGDTALKNVVLTDDRIQTVTYVSGDTNSNGLLDTTETWTYKATEVASSGTIKNTGTVTAVDNVGGVASVTDKDDAYYTGSGATKGSIGDRVWIDTDGDGVQDSGEAGLSGVKVVLKGAGADGAFGTADDITATTTTGNNGYYLFSNLDAGKYQLDFSDASTRLGYTETKQNIGSNDAVDSDVDASGKTATITLGAGQQNLTVDAGVYKKASVGDKVWEDLNHNSIQDSNEPGIGNITVKLLNSAGTVIATTKTSTSGNYLFSDLDPGTYSLQFDKTNVSYKPTWDTTTYNLNDWKWAKKDTGSNDAVDSDVAGDGVAKTNVTVTSQFTLESGENDMTRDAGITPIVIDLNGDGIHTISRANSTGSFDLLGNGTAIKSGWISSSDGFLAVDKNGNGSIDSVNELFGGTSKGAGYAALAGYDSNGDGVVDQADADFDKLLVWQDLNGDHQSSANELMTLAQAGIASLTVAHTDLQFLDAQGNVHGEASSVTTVSGATLGMTDVYFNVSAEDAAAAGVTLPNLADLLGFDTLDSVVGPAAAGVADVSRAQAESCDDASDGGEALRRMAMAVREESHHNAV